MAKATTLFQTVNPDGSITFDFTGHIHATGVDLDAVPGVHSSVAAQRLEWLRTNDGALVANVYGYGDDAVGGVSGIIAQNVDASRGAQFAAIAGPVGEAVQFTRAQASAQGIVRNIIQGDGGSDFLQLLTNANLKFSYGAQNVNIANGANNGTLAVATGVNLLHSWCNAYTNPPLSVGAAKVAAMVGQNLTLQAYTANLAAVSAAINILVSWFAIGT